jgi:hypothetical protein
MAPIISQFANIFIHYYSNKAFSTCKLFISEPTKRQEDKMGRLFGIVEINTPSRENASIITQIISDLEEIYYSQAEEENLELETIFEKSLDQINQKFSQLIKDKKFYLVGNLSEQTIKEKINLAVGVLKNNQLHLAYLNNIGVFLVHKTKQDYKIIDIRKIASEEKSDKNGQGTKLFSNLISGEINPPDFLFLANNDFLNFISQERILKIITSLPIHKAAEYFKNSLLQHEGHNFASIIIKNSFQDQTEIKTPYSLSSITELNYTETSTEKLLEPSFWDNIKAFLNFSWTKLQFKSPEVKIVPNEAVQDVGAEKIPTIKQKRTNRPLNFLSMALKFIGLKLKRAGHILMNKMPAVKEKSQILKNFLRLKIAYFGIRIKKIPNLSKILLIIAILLVILFVYSTSYFKQQKQKDITSAEFQNIASQFEEKRNQAESDLIYGNEEKARTELAEAQTLLASLSVESQRQKDKQKELAATLESIIAKLRHITTISAPDLIADLSSQIDTDSDLKNIIFKANNLLVFDSGTNNSYQINIDSREIKKVASNLSDIGLISKAKMIDNRILLYHSKNGFVEYKDERYSPITVDLPANAKIIDFSFYNNRLYTADQAANQIYRQPKTDTGFGTGNNWLRDQNDLANIIGMNIDTNIWLLDKTGSILKFNKGKKSNFEPKNLEPALEAPVQLITNDQTNYLYILEPKNKRIVVLDKEGNLITQYYSNAFDNLKAMEIVEKEKKMFLIDGNKIYFINLSHI